MSQLSSRDKNISFLEELYTLLDLEEGWDGENAIPVSKELVSLASDFLSQAYDNSTLRNLSWFNPRISPILDGRIGVEWVAPTRYLLLLLDNSPSVEFVKRNQVGELESGTIDSSGAIHNLIPWACQYVNGVAHPAQG